MSPLGEHEMHLEREWRAHVDAAHEHFQTVLLHSAGGLACWEIIVKKRRGRGKERGRTVRNTRRPREAR